MEAPALRNNVLILALGRFLQAALAVAVMRVMTRMLSPAQVGDMYIILALAAGLSRFFIAPVGQYINRRLNAWRAEKSVSDHFFAFNIYVAGVSLLAVPVVLTAKWMLGAGLGLTVAPLTLVVAGYLFCNTWNSTAISTLNMFGHSGMFVVFSVLTVALGLVCSAVCAVRFSHGALAWMTGQIAANFLLAVVGLGALKMMTREGWSGRFFLMGRAGLASMRGLWEFALPLSAAMLCAWLQNQAYRMIVVKSAGAEYLGFLGVGLGIASSLAAVTESLVHQVYFPAFYRELTGGAEQRRKALAELSDKSIPVYILLAAFTISLAHPLTRLLVAPQFGRAEKFVMFGALIEFFRMTSSVFAAAAHSEMRTRVLIKPYAVGGIVTCAAVAAACGSPAKDTLIPLGMVIGGFVMLIAMRAATRRLLPLEFDHGLLFKSAALASAFTVFLAGRGLTSHWSAAALLFMAGAYAVIAAYCVSFRIGRNAGSVDPFRELAAQWSRR